MTLAQHSSKSNEHYTPAAYVDPARWLMGDIDLDPASCALANTVIRARYFYTQELDGFRQPWGGRVWLNPPGGKVDKHGNPVAAGPGAGNMLRWWVKLAQEHQAGRVHSAVFVLFQLNILQRAQPECRPLGLPTPLDLPILFPSRRINYLKPDGRGGLVESKDATHPSAICYLPPLDSPKAGAHRFAAAYQHLGLVNLPGWAYA